MIAVIKENTSKEQLDHLINWLSEQNVEVHISAGVHHTVLGLVGDTTRIDIELLNSLAIVETVIENFTPKIPLLMLTALRLAAATLR